MRLFTDVWSTEETRYSLSASAYTFRAGVWDSLYKPHLPEVCLLNYSWEDSAANIALVPIDSLADGDVKQERRKRERKRALRMCDGLSSLMSNTHTRTLQTGDRSHGRLTWSEAVQPNDSKLTTNIQGCEHN